MNSISEKYYDIIECNNDRKDANYSLKIKWKIEKIAGYSKAEGFVVQRVELLDETGIIPNYEGSYYEAWEIIEGKTKYTDFDDEFRNGLDNEIDIITDIVTENSRGKKGKIEYFSKVFWVDKSTATYNEVKQWKSTVTMANELPSVLESNCNLFIEASSIFERQFCHYVDF